MESQGRRLAHPLFIALVAGMFVLAGAYVQRSGSGSAPSLDPGELPKLAATTPPGVTTPAMPLSGGGSVAEERATAIATTTTTHSAENLIPDGLKGHWRGSINQPTFGVYGIDLRIQAGTFGQVVGHSRYPILECEGDLVLIDVSTGLIMTREQLVLNDRRRCADRPILVIKLVDKNSIDVRIFNPGRDLSGTPTGHGVLSRS